MTHNILDYHTYMYIYFFINSFLLFTYTITIIIASFQTIIIIARINFDPPLEMQHIHVCGITAWKEGEPGNKTSCHNLLNRSTLVYCKFSVKGIIEHFSRAQQHAHAHARFA